MSKMKSDGDKCQFLDSDPKTQLHMDVTGGGGVVGEKRLSNQQHMGEKLRGLSRWEILVNMSWLPRSARGNLGGIIRGLTPRKREAMVVSQPQQDQVGMRPPTTLRGS